LIGVGATNLIYGPFYRVQTDEKVTRLQIESREVWGAAPRNTYASDFAQVQAYTEWIFGDLAKGIRFMTEVPPNSGTPAHRAIWSGDRPGVYIEGEYVKIKVTEIDYYP
jgi:hypothetical protein